MFRVLSKKIKIAIFEISGTIVDPYGYQSIKAMDFALRSHSIPVVVHRLLDSSGYGERRRINNYIECLKLPSRTADSVFDAYIQRYSSFQDRILTTPDIHHLLRDLKEKNVKLIATSSLPNELVNSIVRPRFGADTWDAVVSSDGVSNNNEYFNNLTEAFNARDKREVVLFSGTIPLLTEDACYESWKVGVLQFSPYLYHSQNDMTKNWDTAHHKLAQVVRGKNGFMITSNIGDNAFIIDDINRMLNSEKLSKETNGWR